MVFEYTGSLLAVPFVLTAFLSSYDLSLVLFVLALAFAVDGIEILLRARGYSRSQPVLSKFRDKLGKKPLTRDLTDFTVIIPTYRNPKELKRSINYLLKAAIPKDKILVVDDFSNDQNQTAETAAKFGVRVISTGRNTAKVGAINVALDAVHTKYVILLDSDSVLLSSCNRIGRAIMEMELLDLDAMAGRIVPCPPKAESYFDVTKDRSIDLSSNMLLELQSLEYDQAMRLGRGPMYAVEVKNQDYKVRYAEVTSVSGAFGLFRRTVLKDIMRKFQMREENFSGEDIERTFKILAVNGKVGYSDDIVVLTSVPADMISHFKQRVDWAAGLFRCSISRFGARVCKRKLAGLTYAVYTIRDILIHPLKLFSMFFLLLNPTVFFSIMAFYILLNILAVRTVNSHLKASTKTQLLLPFYRLYMSVVPTTIGYLKAFLHGIKIYMQGNRHIPPTRIINTWNCGGEPLSL